MEKGQKPAKPSTSPKEAPINKMEWLRVFRDWGHGREKPLRVKPGKPGARFVVLCQFHLLGWGSWRQIRFVPSRHETLPMCR